MPAGSQPTSWPACRPCTVCRFRSGLWMRPGWWSVSWSPIPSYAPGPVLLDVRVDGDVMEVAVWDGGPVLPVVWDADVGRVGQHGLEIVMAVAQGFAVQREPVGKRITVASHSLLVPPRRSPHHRSRLNALPVCARPVPVVEPPTPVVPRDDGAAPPLPNKADLSSDDVAPSTEIGAKIPKLDVTSRIHSCGRSFHEGPGIAAGAAVEEELAAFVDRNGTPGST